MKVHVESVFDCPAPLVWNELLNYSSFAYIIKPLVYAQPHTPQPFPERLYEDLTLVIRPYLFSFIPMSKKTIKLETVDHQALFMQTREFDALVDVWDHAISVRDIEHGQTRYSDTIEIEAGIFTSIVCLFAKWFYRHRQNRWKKLLVTIN